MKESLKWQLLLIFLLVAIAGYFAYPSQDKPFFREGEIFSQCRLKLGLDLQGGSELILGFKGELAKGVAEKGIDQARHIIQRRIDALGLKEPIVRPYSSDQLQIQLPGIDPAEVKRIRYILTTSGRLEFKLEANQDLVKAYEPRKPQAPEGYRWYTKAATDREISEEVLVGIDAVLKGDHIVDAGWRHTMEEGIVVSLKLNQEGATIFADVTGRHHEKSGDPRRLAIILDDKLESAPSIRTKITGGEAVITRGRRGFPMQEAQDLAMILSSGSLPATLEIKSDNTVGSTLGKDAINRSVIAFGLSLIVVALFMIIYYRAAGLVSVIALVMNAILILGCLSLFGATVTLPGIAGLILTMGMAIDSNVLFYERIREEKARGRPALQAFESGFLRAFVAVFDSNITTLLAGLILLWLGTGPVKGFAITLSIGILTTLFTAYFASKAMLRFSLESGLIREISQFQILAQPRINFISTARTLIKVSLIAIVGSLVIFLGWGGQSLGIDFSGGTVINMRFNQPQNIADIRQAIRNITITEEGVTKPKYPDAEIQTVLPPVTDTAHFSALFSKVGSTSQEFQLRTSFVKTDDQRKELENDLLAIFKDKLVQEPIREITPINKVDYHTRIVLQLDSPITRTVLESKLKESAKAKGLQEPWVLIITPDGAEEATDSFSTNFVIYCKEEESHALQWQELLKETLNLSGGPFPQAGTVGVMVSRTLQQNAVLAILLSWIGMIIYLAFRFELKYGLAAVVALVHDVIIAVGGTVLFNRLVPDTWGINVEINFVSVAAFMTIIGYSVNDTIVIFDRVRENLNEMKGETFGNIINASVNQTLSRTIITALTVFLTVVILFGITAQSGGGIASFAFPMVIGCIAGVYSTVYIASPFVMMWGGTKGG